MRAYVLVEDLLDCQAAFKHLHLFLLLQHHLQPLLSPQDLLLQRRLQFLQARRRHESTFISNCVKLNQFIQLLKARKHFQSTSIS